MASISNLSLTNGEVTWQCGDHETTLNIGASQAVLDPEKSLVFVLTEQNSSAAHLKIFSELGALLVDLHPPSEFRFSYLTRHPDVGVAVVAGANQKVEGWFDWHFGYDESKKKLFRHCPAY